MGQEPRRAVYPGSFDPLTNGHVDLIRRGAALFDEIIVAVLTNASKQPLFSVDERVAIIREAFADRPQVKVEAFAGLLVDYARARRATTIVRGLRAVADFEYELQMALMNRHLDADIETVFMMPDERYTYVSSHLVREVAGLGGSLAGLVPPVVESRLAARRLHTSAHRA